MFSVCLWLYRSLPVCASLALPHAYTVTTHSVTVHNGCSYTTGKLCGRLSDHTQSPEISQCGGVVGRYVTVAHDREHGGSSDGIVVTICEAKVFGIRGTVDQASCKCTPRCAQDSLNMAVRCCADVRPHDAGLECEAKQAVGYTGKYYLVCISCLACICSHRISPR